MILNSLKQLDTWFHHLFIKILFSFAVVSYFSKCDVFMVFIYRGRGDYFVLI